MQFQKGSNQLKAIFYFKRLSVESQIFVQFLNYCLAAQPLLRFPPQAVLLKLREELPKSVASCYLLSYFIDFWALGLSLANFHFWPVTGGQ